MCDIPTDLSRRRLVRLVSLATGALTVTGVSTLFATQDGVLRETADLVTGPFYPRVKPSDKDADLTLVRGHQQRAAGQLVRLSGRVTNLKGEPLRNAPIQIWQANTHGRYAHPSDPNTRLALDPDFQGYALLRTDNEGRYRFTTIKPGAYPTGVGDWIRPPHIHFDVSGQINRLVTQMYFEGDALNDKDKIRQSIGCKECLTAKLIPPTKDLEPDSLIAVWDIVLPRG